MGQVCVCGLKVVKKGLGKGTRRLMGCRDWRRRTSTLGRQKCPAGLGGRRGCPSAALLRLEQQEGDEKHHGARGTLQRPPCPHSPSSDELHSGSASCPGQPHGGRKLLMLCHTLDVMSLILDAHNGLLAHTMLPAQEGLWAAPGREGGPLLPLLLHVRVRTGCAGPLLGGATA